MVCVRTGRLTHFLDGGDEQRNQDRNDGDHDKKLDQTEGATIRHEGPAFRKKRNYGIRAAMGS